MLKDATVANVSNLKGLGVLTSDQNRKLLKRMETPRVDVFQKCVDKPLLKAYFELLNSYSYKKDYIRSLKSNVMKAVCDKGLTKEFVNWNNTLENLDGYFSDPSDYNFSHLRAYRNAKLVMKHLFPSRCLKYRPIYRGMDTSKVWSNPDASAGAIGKGSKRDNEIACIDAALKIKEGIANGVPFNSLQIPAIPTHRAQIGGFYDTVDYDNPTYFPDDVKMKDRFVWIIDGATTLVESSTACSVQEYLSHCMTWYAGGKSPEEMRSIIRNFTYMYPYWVSLDYSKYDQTVPAKVIHDVFKEFIRPCFDDKYHDELKWIEYNFIHTKVMLPGNRMVTKHRGIPSGSMYTQIIGTLCNLLIGLTYLCSKCDANEKDPVGYVLHNLRGFGRNIEMISIMGDDNLWGYRQPIDKEDWAGYVGKVFGLKIHPDKCATSDQFEYPEYLKRLWTPGGEKMSLLYIIVNGVHPERGPRKYEDYTPYHIMYGMFYAYRASFLEPWFTEQWLVKKMRMNGGLEALKTLKTHELPGVFRGFSSKAKDNMYFSAKAIEAQQLFAEQAS